jgi:hypothetical protein
MKRTRLMILFCERGVHDFMEAGFIDRKVMFNGSPSPDCKSSPERLVEERQNKRLSLHLPFHR